MSLPLLLAALTTFVSVRVDTAPGHRLNTVRPLRALGAGIDSDPPGKIRLLYGPQRTRRMLAAGLGSLSYRLYTELSIQDWHWNPRGAYSDARRRQGYWTSAEDLGAPIVDSFGYRLPHRGSTRDQGDDDGYSRADDGDPTTFWKSNPYLTSAYTHEPDARYPQWAVVDLGRPQAVDALHIAWANPYATRYDVQYWTGNDAILEQAGGRWHTFSLGRVRGAKGGTQTVRVSRVPQVARFIRVSMSASSGTCDVHGSVDRRNCMGYAIGEIGVGTLGPAGFHDLVRHAPCGGEPHRKSVCGVRQTPIFTSSDDPWHRERDRVFADQEQTGLDFIARNPVTRGLPVMYPVPLFYSTPENAVAEVRYLRARGYPIAYIELGEEVDGQYATPEDYGALYLQAARVIHAVAPEVRLGGPVFQGVNSDVTVWRDARGDVSWLHRFVRYLKLHDALDELGFMSFEHYPFKGCDQGAVLHADLLREPSLVRGIVATWRADGLPANVPLMITEGNFASDGGPVPQQLEGALWWGDYIGASLSSGVARVYHYQYEAEPLGRKRECERYGNYGMFVTDEQYRIRARAAQFYAAQLLTREWLAPGDAPQQIFPVSTGPAAAGRGLTAYAAKRSDGEWSLLLVNKDRVAHRLHAEFAAAPHGAVRAFGGPVTRIIFGRAQYAWQGRAANELPNPNQPPQRTLVASGRDATFAIPPEALVVLRGRLAK